MLEAASGGRSDSCRGDRGGVSLATWPWSERARGEWAVAAVAGAILGAARGLVMRLYPARVACIDGAGLWLSGTAPLEVFSLLGMTVRDDRLMSGTLAALLRLYKLGLLLAGVALLLLVGRAPDAEANSWVVQQAASPPPVPAGNFSVVSCPSTGYCAAVGVGPIGFLAAAWNGAAWRSTSIPTPVDVNSPRLTALSCASRSFCVAIGSTSTSGGGHPFAEIWSGGQWTMRSAAQPVAVRAAVLSGVSCRSHTFCVAVGSRLNRRYRVIPLSERWNGARWSIQAGPPPGVDSASRLSAVSCTSVKACTAVGSASVTRHVHRHLVFDVFPVAERWNGKDWTLQTVNDPSSRHAFSGISCTSSRFCLAVGSGGPGSSPTESGPLAERWNGRQWSRASAPVALNTGGYGTSAFTQVSCARATLCVAVGTWDFENGGDASATGWIAQRWNGSAWVGVLGSNPNDNLANRQLNGVSCSAGHGCTVVGATYNANEVGTFTRVWRLTPTHSSVQQSPNELVPGYFSLTDISCPSANSCVAVGGYSDATGAGRALVERWDGVSWSIQAAPGSGTLAGVSCPSTSFCLALAGSDVDEWNGVTWSSMPSALPDSTSLVAVSCVSADACMGVAGGPSGPVSEWWNGTIWSLQQFAQLPPNTGPLDVSISCGSVTACTAVVFRHLTAGLPVQAQPPIAESWNGTSWTVAAQPTSSSGGLSSVSCPSAAFCSAVGFLSDSSGVTVAAAAEAWNGSTWTVEGAPQGTGLVGVSCTAADACTALAGGTSIQTWDGKAWTAQPPAPGATGSLSRISCGSATSCTAIGTTPTNTPLIEHSS